MRRTRLIGLSLVVVSVFLGSMAVVPAALGSAKAPRAVHGVNATTRGTSTDLAAQLADARLATAKYALNLRQAKKDGYFILTRGIPDMGYHFLNPNITGFDITKPPILVYEKHGDKWQLGAFEWVFPETPATPPLEGATYGTFGAACHYRDGTFVFEPAQSDCPAKSPDTGSRFRFWHPDLITMHVWVWYPNPDGLYSGTNPLVHPFNSV